MLLNQLQREMMDALSSEGEDFSLFFPEGAIEIYQHHIKMNKLKSLRQIYPLTEKIVGEGFFVNFSKKYIEHYPSRSGNLNDYGEYFSDFISKSDSLAELFYLSEVAQFEWICHQLSFVASSNQTLDYTLLANLTDEKRLQVRLILNPSSLIKLFHYPILQIIDLCQGKIEGPIQIDQGDHPLLFLPKHHDLHILPLTKSDYIFLTAIAEHHPFLKAVELVLSNDSNFKIDEKLPVWIQQQLIIDCV